MGIYTGTWRVTVTTITAVSVVPALRSAGWTAVVLVGILAPTGAAFAWCWYENRDGRRPVVVRTAIWSACGGTMTLGLPPLIGAWSLLVLTVLGLASPLVLTSARRAVTAGRPAPPAREPSWVEQLSDRDLERRWRSTTRRVRSRGLAPATVVAVVAERALLLDELERRDPDRFATWLVSAV